MSGAPDVDTITDFDAIPFSDNLMLVDVLQDENHGILFQYLHFNFDGSDTTIEVRTEGLSSAGVDLEIVLAGYDATAGGTPIGDSAIIQSLLSTGKLFTE